jgi:metal-sulfur cluster biosynthetic enzyme
MTEAWPAGAPAEPPSDVVPAAGAPSGAPGSDERPSDPVTATLPETRPATPEELLEALKDVVDPELGVNVVDLGLVYGIDRDDDGHVTVDMTLTSPMCPLTDQLEFDVRYVLGPMATSVAVNWVWLPQWTLDNITDDGREQLRALGYSV